MLLIYLPIHVDSRNTIMRKMVVKPLGSMTPKHRNAFSGTIILKTSILTYTAMIWHTLNPMSHTFILHRVTGLKALFYLRHKYKLRNKGKIVALFS